MQEAVTMCATREKRDNSYRWQHEDDPGSSIFAPLRFPEVLPAVRPIRKYSTLSPCSLHQEVRNRDLVRCSIISQIPELLSLAHGIAE